MNLDFDPSKYYAVGYARESMAERKEARGQKTKSVDQQTDLIAGWAARVGVRLGEVLSDKVSASDYSTRVRESWEEVLHLLDTGRRNMLICWEPSRLSRDQVVWAQLMYVCRHRRVLIVVDGKIYDPTDVGDELTLNMLFLLGQMEVRNLAKRVGRDSVARAVEGMPNGGRIAIGLRHRYELVPGKPPRLAGVEPDWDHVPLVRRVFDLYVTKCLSKAKIAALLNEEGVPTVSGGHTWRDTNIDRMLRNKAYIGCRVLKGEVVNEAAWPAIIDQEIFWAAQRKLLETKAEPFSHSRGRVYRLSSIPKCGVCGESMRGAPAHRKKPPRYRCIKGHVSISLARLEEYMDGFMEELLSTNSWFRPLAKADDAEEAAVRVEHERARTELAELEALVARGEMTLRLAALAEKGIMERLKEAEQRLAAASLPLPVRRIVGPRAAATWRGLGADAQREIIQACVRMTIKPDPTGSRPVQERVEIVPVAR